MRVHLRQIQDKPGGAPQVKFTCPYGSGTAGWVGREPQVDGWHTAELVVPDVLAWGSEIEPSDRTPSIFEEGGRTCVVGQLRGYADGGHAVVQLGEELISIQIAGGPRSPVGTVIIRLGHLNLSDLCTWAP